MVDEVAKWKKIFGSEHIIQFRMMYEELVKEVTADGIRKAQKGEMSVKEVMDFINSTAANVGLLQYQDKAIPARHKVSAEKTVGGTTLRKEVTYNKNIDELPPEDEAALFEDLNDDIIEGGEGG